MTFMDRKCASNLNIYIDAKNLEANFIKRLYSFLGKCATGTIS